MTFVILAGLAVARATRLYRDDSVTEGVRDRVEDFLVDGRRARDHPRFSQFCLWLAELLLCPFCLSGWLSLIVVVLVDSATSRSVPVPILVWLAVWWVACFAYFALELVADADALAWGERERRGLD